MAVYKVIQDIEAEDKLLGPLTLKGFIYAGITVFLGFINFEFITAGSLGPIRWLMVLVFLPPMILFGLLASPIGRDQPTEVWLLSHVRFWLKSRLRIWNQSGVKELVTVTAPKKIEQQLTKNLSMTEVKSRLTALANTMDSRGWAVKNVSVNDTRLLSYLEAEESETGGSDRLVNASSVLHAQPVQDIRPSDDIMDSDNNAKAKEINDLLTDEEKLRREKLVTSLNKPQPNQPTANRQPRTAKAVTPPAQTARLKELAQSGSALSVASVAKLASETSKIKQISPTEAVISLH